jgi:hypothetical protein
MFINKYKYVNFVYGDNKNRIMTGDAFEPLGKNMQVEATNTAGKSISIITLLQAIVPLVDTDKNSLDVFTNKEPVYMLIEWVSEDNTRVLTGVGIERKQQNFSEDDKRQEKSKLFDIITFIVEYDRPNKFDLDNIEITYEKEDKLYCKSISEVCGMFDRCTEKVPGVKFMKLYKKSYLKDYKEKLEEFGIFPEEWSSVIAKLNIGESALTKYYEENNTTEKLIKNLIIPTIEESIENLKNYSFIKDIQDSLKKYREFAKEHRNEIEEYDSLSKMKEKLEGVINATESRITLEGSEESLKIKFGALYNSVMNASSRLDDLKKEKEKNIEALNTKKLEITFHRDSREYLKLETDIKDLKEDISALDGELIEIEALIEKSSGMIALCDLKELSIRRKAIIEDISQLQAEKDKFEKSQGQIMEKLNNLGFSLKTYYAKEITALENKQVENKTKEMKLRSKEASLEAESGTLTNQISQFQLALGKLEAFFEGYNKEEAAILDIYKDASDYIINTLEGKNFDINGLIRATVNIAENFNTDKLRAKEEVDKYKKEYEGLDKKLYEAAFEAKTKGEDRSRLNEELDKFLERKEDLIGRAAKFSLNGANLFKGEIFAQEITELIKQKRIKVDTASEAVKEITKELDFLQGDSNFSLSSAVREEFENLGVPVINGLEWLNKQGLSAEEKLKVYRENPMLIYSLIVTNKELEILKNTTFKIGSSSPIPLLLRENLTDNGIWQLSNNVAESITGRFILFYDSNMLDERLLEEKIKSLKEQQSKLEMSISKLNADVDSLYDLKNSIENFKYDGFYEEKTQGYINDLNKVMVDIVNTENDIKRQMPEIETRIKDKENNIQEYGSLIAKAKEKIQRLNVFNENYCSVYEDNMKKRNSVNESIKNNASAIKLNQEELKKTRKSKEDISSSKERLSERIDNLKSTTAKYASYKSGTIITEELSVLQGMFTELSSNSKAEDINKINRRLSGREEEKNKVDAEVSELDKKVKNRDFDLIMESKEYYESAFHRYSKEERNKSDAKIRKESTCAEKEKTLSESYHKIISNHGKPPLTGDKIMDVNYKEEMLTLDRNLQGVYNDLKEMGELFNKIRVYIEALKDYEGVTYEEENLDIETIQASYNKLKENRAALDGEIKAAIDKLMKAQSELAPYLSGDRIEVYNTIVGMTDFHDKKDFCTNVFIATEGELDRLLARKMEMEGEKEYIYNTIKDYVDEVMKGIKMLNSIARINRERLMKITLKDENIDYNEIKNIIDSVASNDNLNINSLITTYYLLEVVAKIKRIQIEIMKYELYNSSLKDWDSLKASSTGAQKFCISFTLLAVLLEYKRFDEKHPERNSLGKVLIMDNPFGEISENTLLKPIFELAEKLKIQIISYTHIQNQAIRDRFDKIYLLKVNRTVSGREIVRLETYKDTVNERASANPFFAEQVAFDSI